METNVCYQGDCLEVMKDIPDNSIDTIITDPPTFTKPTINMVLGTSSSVQMLPPPNN